MLIARGQHNYGKRFVDEGVGAVLHFAGRITLGVNVGDFLELERAFKRDGEMDAAAEIEEIADVGEVARKLLAGRGTGAEDGFNLGGNAAKLFHSWMHGREGQQLLIDYARQYSPHAQAVEKPGVRKLSEIKLMREDPEGVEKAADEVKRRYTQYFKV